MRITQNKNKTVYNFNILILASSVIKLWEYREICKEIDNKEGCHLNMILTKEIETALRVSGFLAEGIDIFISDRMVEKAVMAKLKENIFQEVPEAHFIIGRGDTFIHSYRKYKEQTIIEVLENGKQKDFADNLKRIVSRVVQENL